MERWRGRVAIVTGSSVGIGAAIATILLENGLKVVGVARRFDRFQKLLETLGEKKANFHPIEGDVSNEKDIIRIIKWTRDNLGGVDVMVNNAGIYNPCPLTTFETSKAKAVFDINVIGLSIFTREAIKDMKDRGIDDGHIFQINSTSGHSVVDFPGEYMYAGSKHALRVLTEGLRRELRDLGSKIKVTSISPGLTRTEVFNEAGEDYSTVFDENPTLHPKDIADALLYSLSTPPHVQIHEMIVQPVGEKW